MKPTKEQIVEIIEANREMFIKLHESSYERKIFFSEVVAYDSGFLAGLTTFGVNVKELIPLLNVKMKDVEKQMLADEKKDKPIISPYTELL